MQVEHADVSVRGAPGRGGMYPMHRLWQDDPPPAAPLSPPLEVSRTHAFDWPARCLRSAVPSPSRPLQPARMGQYQHLEADVVNHKCCRYRYQAHVSMKLQKQFEVHSICRRGLVKEQSNRCSACAW